MKHENRVIHRLGARELTREEMNKVTGGIHTLTICTVTTPTTITGDETGPETC